MIFLFFNFQKLFPSFAISFWVSPCRTKPKKDAATTEARAEELIRNKLKI